MTRNALQSTRTRLSINVEACRWVMGGERRDFERRAAWERRPVGGGGAAARKQGDGDLFGARIERATDRGELCVNSRADSAV